MKYRFGRRELDVGARRIFDGAAICHVEPQVFDLILYLVENRARIVDKDELLARVWKGRVVSDATIASRLNAARRALGDDGHRQAVIATLPRRGFRFVAEVTTEGNTLGRPAVAVMPFTLLSEDQSDIHLARGLADQLAAALGQAAWFDVRDTAASFAATLNGLTLIELCQMLDVGYLVMGSLQASGEALRLSVRLTDPKSGRHVWSASFTGTRDEIFDMQDGMAVRVLGEIEPRLRHSERKRSQARHGNFTAFDHYLRAADALRGMDIVTACAELDKAVGEFPSYPAAHAMRAWIGTLMLPQGHRVDPGRERERCRIALAEGGFECDALSMAGYALGFFDRDPAIGLGYVRRALALNPSAARADDHAGWLLLYASQASDALVHFDRALALCPIDEFAFRMLTGRAFAHLFLRRFKAAAEDARRAHAAAPRYTVCHRVLVAALAHLGREATARAVLKELLSINPNLSLARYARETRFEGVADREVLFGGLRRAGLR